MATLMGKNVRGEGKNVFFSPSLKSARARIKRLVELRELPKGRYIVKLNEEQIKHQVGWKTYTYIK